MEIDFMFKKSAIKGATRQPAKLPDSADMGFGQGKIPRRRWLNAQLVAEVVAADVRERATGPGARGLLRDYAASCIVLSSTILRRRVMAGSLSTTVSPTLRPTSVFPIGEDMLTCPSSNSTESPNTRL